MIDYIITVMQPPQAVVVEHSEPQITIDGFTGPQGPQGPPGAAWQAMTQAEYNALGSYDPLILYVII